VDGTGGVLGNDSGPVLGFDVVITPKPTPELSEGAMQT
jgi:hypothetical protein